MFWIEMTLFFEAKNDLKWPQIKVTWPIVEKKWSYMGADSQ